MSLGADVFIKSSKEGGYIIGVTHVDFSFQGFLSAVNKKLKNRRRKSAKKKNQNVIVEQSAQGRTPSYVTPHQVNTKKQSSSLHFGEVSTVLSFQSKTFSYIVKLSMLTCFSLQHQLGANSPNYKVLQQRFCRQYVHTLPHPWSKQCKLKICMQLPSRLFCLMCGGRGESESDKTTLFKDQVIDPLSSQRGTNVVIIKFSEFDFRMFKFALIVVVCVQVEILSILLGGSGKANPRSHLHVVEHTTKGIYPSCLFLQVSGLSTEAQLHQTEVQEWNTHLYRPRHQSGQV